MVHRCASVRGPSTVALEEGCKPPSPPGERLGILGSKVAPRVVALETVDIVEAEVGDDGSALVCFMSQHTLVKSIHSHASVVPKG